MPEAVEKPEEPGDEFLSGTSGENVALLTPLDICAQICKITRADLSL